MPEKQRRFRGLHGALWKVCRNQEAYRGGTDTEGHEKPDCSCGCRWFVGLAAIGDWAVCACPSSPRAGLLTFEHMGCAQFKSGKSIDGMG